MAKENESNLNANYLTDRQKVFLSGFINLNIHNLELSWDLDQTLKISETPVKEKCDNDFNTEFKNRNIDGYGSVSRWLLEDKVFTNEKEAVDYEMKIWTDPEVLIKAEPNQSLRNLSYAAFMRGIPQSVVTVRTPALRQVTHKWLSIHFPWISPGNICLNIGGSLPGSEFKINTIKDKFNLNPNLIHIDDDVAIIRKLVKSLPVVGVVGIVYPSDKFSDLNNASNRVFISRDELNSKVYYGSMNINMLSRTM